jgi:hypothetical protein
MRLESPPVELIELSLLDSADLQGVLATLARLSQGVPAFRVAREVLGFVRKELKDQELVTEENLADYLFARVPDIAVRFIEEAADWNLATSVHFMLGRVLKPHLERLIDAGDEIEVQRIFDHLEILANRSDALVRNELFVILEDMDRWRVWKFLSPTLRAAQFEAVSWFPTMRNRETPANEHVDMRKYQERWLQEIDGIGGFASLTVANELFIRHKLVQEFGIEGLRAPEPGGEEWLRIGLPWPFQPRVTAE